MTQRIVLVAPPEHLDRAFATAKNSLGMPHKSVHEVHLTRTTLLRVSGTKSGVSVRYMEDER